MSDRFEKHAKAGKARLPAAILFDCDGTLLLTSDLHFRAMSETVARQGFVMPRAWYMGLTGLGRRDLFAQFAVDFALKLDQARCATESIALTMAMSAEARENSLVANFARLASDRLPIAVVTNGEGAIVRAFLGSTGLLSYFNHILGIEDALRAKPAPDLYLTAAARLGVPPRECLVLEDSDQGIQAAHSAGMSCHDVRTPDWPEHCMNLTRDIQCLPKGVVNV